MTRNTQKKTFSKSHFPSFSTVSISSICKGHFCKREGNEYVTISFVFFLHILHLISVGVWSHGSVICQKDSHELQRMLRQIVKRQRINPAEVFLKLLTNGGDMIIGAKCFLANWFLLQSICNKMIRLQRIAEDFLAAKQRWLGSQTFTFYRSIIIMYGAYSSTLGRDACAPLHSVLKDVMTLKSLQNQRQGCFLPQKPCLVALMISKLKDERPSKVVNFSPKKP